MTKPGLRLLLLGSCVLLYACGGPAPIIKHRLSMEMLTNSPPDVRASVADAYRNHYRAKLTLAHTEFLLDDVDYELQIARAEKSKAKQSKKIAKIQSKRNLLAYKLKLMDEAKARVFGFDKKSSALDERIRYLKAQRRYLRKGVIHGKAAIYHTEARFELAKAKLANERKTIPKGFKLAAYVSQEKRTGKVAAKRAKSSKAAQNIAIEKERAWKKASK